MTINSLKRQKWLALLLGSFFITSSAFAALTTPVVTSYPQNASSTPVTISGTADASTTVTVTGGSATSTASTDVSGNWTASVGLTPNTINHLSVVADDGMGSTSSSTMIDITFDNTAPVFGTTTNVMATTTSSSGTHVAFTNPVVTDNLDNSATVTCSPISGSLFALGTTTVNCTATDNAGNTATTSFLTIVSQVGGSGSTTATSTAPITITAPVIHLGQFCVAHSPVTITGTADANSTIRVTGGQNTATTTTNGSGFFSLPVNLTGSTSSPLILSVLDSGGNVVATTSVSALFETAHPTITLNGQSNIAMFVNTNFSDQGATAVDELGNTIAVASSSDVNTSQTGTYHIVYTASDCAGNQATTTRTVEVVPAGSSGGGSSNGGGNSSSAGSSLGGLVNASGVVNSNSAVAFVFAGLVIDDSPRVGIPNTGGTFTFLTLMTQGLRGVEVTELQTLLKELGFYNGPITGQFGPLTRAAVMAYQRAHGITQTGSVGVKTLAALNASILANR